MHSGTRNWSLELGVWCTVPGARHAQMVPRTGAWRWCTMVPWWCSVKVRWPVGATGAVADERRGAGPTSRGSAVLSLLHHPVPRA